jgi:hypothetical protein
MRSERQAATIALTLNIGEHPRISTFPARLFGTNPSTCSSDPMAKASKSGRAVIPEPSFGFFLRAMGAMLLLVAVMTAYFSLRT